MDLGILYEKVFKAMTSGGIQSILDAVYDIVKLPLMVIDTSYNVLAATNNDQFKDKIWDYIIKERHASDDLIWAFYENKYIEYVCKNTRPVYLDWGIIGIPNFCGAIRINGVVSAYIAMLCPSVEFKEEYIDVLEIAANAMTINISTYKNRNTQNNPMLEIFIRDLIDGAFHYEKQLETWKKDFKHIFKEKYSLVAILPESKDMSGILQYLSSILSREYSKMLSTILTGTLFLFFYDINTDIKMKEIAEGIKKELSSFHFHYSISRCFSNILDTPNYRFQVEKALELGCVLQPKSMLYQYEDYAVPAILSYAAKEMDSLNYMHPAIYDLEKYDKENNTEYLATLETYISYMCNTRRTAEKLHIHRNTMLYRINKISELTKCDLDDENICAHLMLSFLMMKLKNNLDTASRGLMCP